jgi:protein gp37
VGADTKIEWCHHTFRGTRVVASEAAWREPLKWDRAAAAAGERHRVFCASLADVFEDRLDLRPARARLFEIIRRTPHLDWLLLTKRPGNALKLIGEAARASYTDEDDNPPCDWLCEWLAGRPPDNIWLGTSVEDQARADERIPHLLRVPAAVRFLSMEPLLSAVDLPLRRCDRCGEHTRDGLACEHCGRQSLALPGGIHWIIVGGESGPGARPIHPSWARSIRDQCGAAGVPFFMKQMNEKDPIPDDLMIREFPR